MASLKYDPDNARIHGRPNVEAIKASLSKFGQRKTIAIQKDGTISAGNGTYEAALELGWTHLAVAKFEDEPAVARAYAISDNRSAELADWDRVQLAETIRDLLEDRGDLIAATGFSEDEIESLKGFLEKDDAGAAKDSLSNKNDVDKDDELTKHLQNDLRYIQLFFVEEIHGEVMGYMRRACEDLGVDSNSDAVLRLLRDRYAAEAAVASN